MIVGLVGRLFTAAARLRPGPTSEPLAHVGEELVRLERPRPQAARTSR
ncbi:MAG: hypothetical protein ABSB97_02365 [Thermoplasmata archaeon]